MKGRKPKPTALHKLSGTLNVTRHRDRKREPSAEGDLDAPPEWMSEGQQESWRYAIEHAPAGVLNLIDRGVLAVWVQAEDMHRSASVAQTRVDVGAETPLLMLGKEGLKPSPYVGIMNRTAMVMMKAASELGFSPVARPRLIVPAKADDEADDPWAGLQVITGGKA